MKIKHIAKSNLEKDAEYTSFLLANTIGDYLWFSDFPESRYQGWFFAPNESLGKEIYKVIEDIRPTGKPKITGINNYFNKAERISGSYKELFIIEEKKHCFIYKLDNILDIEIVLDIRNSYSDDYPEYSFDYIENKILVTAKTEGKEIYLAIKGFDQSKIINERFVRKYNFDEKRNSPPFEKAVYKALKLTGSTFIFCVAETKEKALKEIHEKREILENISTNEPIDFIAAEKGLKNLTLNENRIYAGLPWFFQFWRRDEAISLGGLKIIDKKKAENVFWNLLKENELGPRTNKIADGIGWTFKRAFLFLNDFDKEKENKLLDYLKKEINLDHQENLLKINQYKETWMDSISREGARIEMQALQLNMYKLGRLIDKENQEKYQKKEEELKKEVLDIFWDGEILADGFIPKTETVDKTIRPNIFLAYYIYPDLLSPEQWINCFKKALYELWLDWGGVSTISKNDPRFNLIHTGENPQSYHNGDSWFFVNNLTAVALNRLDEVRFSYEINKILEASREELMWMGSVGHHSEISSADKLSSNGAISQAWSFGTYLEAMYEIVKIKNFD